MNQFVQHILAMLLTIVSPGQSVYSRVALQSCDAACQSTPLCQNLQDWRCKAPQFSQQLYEQNLNRLTAQGIEVKKAMEQARISSYTRPETFEEGLVRYTIIAQAIADVSEESTQSICKKNCDAADKANECHQACLISSPWIWNRAELAFMIATVTNQESGFRSDVHGGVGTLGRGDCQWQFSDGRKATPFAKGASPIANSCRSVCLGQINIGSGTTSNGWNANDLTGIDYNSTKRCLTSVARHLSSSRMQCTRWAKGNTDWSKATFSAYGTGSSCVAYQKKTVVLNGKRLAQYVYRVKDADGKIGIAWGSVPPDNAISKDPVEAGWPAKRANIFQSYLRLYNKKSLVLSQDTQAMLLEPRISRAVTKLMTSQTAIRWQFPIEIKQEPPTNVSQKVDVKIIETAQK